MSLLLFFAIVAVVEVEVALRQVPKVDFRRVSEMRGSE